MSLSFYVKLTDESGHSVNSSATPLSTSSGRIELLKSATIDMSTLTDDERVFVEIYQEGNGKRRGFAMSQVDASQAISIQKQDHLDTEYRYTERTTNNLVYAKLPEDFYFNKHEDYFIYSFEAQSL